jgi:hypothetical protein
MAEHGSAGAKADSWQKHPPLLLPVGFSFPHPIPSLQAVAMKSKRILLLAELALIIAGVFVFRSLWMLLDAVVFMHTLPVLWLSLVGGSAVTVWALHYICQYDGK